MEDFAQVFGIFPEGKYKSVSYANIASVLRAEAGEQDAYEFVKRLVFGAHRQCRYAPQELVLLYPDARTPVLSPAYDFVATLPYICNDKLAIAGLPLLPTLRIVRETVEATAAAWRTLAYKDLLPADRAAASTRV